MKRYVIWITLLVSTTLLYGCSHSERDQEVTTELSISAAASLTDAITELADIYEKENGDVSLTLNFGSSRKLATQIEQGAPADVFLSASQDDIKRLHKKGLLVDSSIVNFTENTLVLITKKDKPKRISSIEQLAGDEFVHLSIGHPDTVPAGAYTKEVLDYLQLWLPLHDKLVMGSDVRQVLTHVEMGNAEYGIVYASDAFISDKVTIVAVANPSMHSLIVYPGAVVKDSKNLDAAQDFLDFVASEQGRAVLQKYGFQ